MGQSMIHINQKKENRGTIKKGGKGQREEDGDDEDKERNVSENEVRVQICLNGSEKVRERVCVMEKRKG